MKRAFFIIMPVLSIFLFSVASAFALTISGEAYLEDQADHSDITIIFYPLTPSGALDTTYTDEDGSYTASIVSGRYDIYFRKEGFGPVRLADQPCYSSTSLDDVTLPVGYTGIRIRGELTGTLAAGVYIADSTIYVPGGTDYTIEPGVTIVFEGDEINFLIEGNLIAEGTEDDSIYFRPQPGYSTWKGIEVTGSYQDTSYMSYVDIQGSSYRAIYLQNTSLKIDHSTLHHNVSEESGSLLYISGRKFVSEYCVYKNNIGERLINNGYQDAIFINDIFVENTATPSLIDFGSSSNSLFQNCLFANNITSENGFDFDGSTVDIVNTIFFNNSGQLTFSNDADVNILYSCFFNNFRGNFNNDASCPADIGNITTTNANGDPCDPYLNIYLNPELISGDFHLYPDSPCIDGGDPSLPHDADDSISDIGAYPFITTTQSSPYPFALTHPFAGEMIWDSADSLVWESSNDPNPDNTPCYDVWLSSTIDFSAAVLVADSISATSVSFSEFQDVFQFSANETYYWKVRATDNNTEGRWSRTTGEFNYQPDPIRPVNLDGNLNNNTGLVQLYWDNGIYNGDTAELRYDPDTYTIFYYWINNTMAVVMHPERSCQLLELKYYTLVTSSENEYIAKVYSWSGDEPSTNQLYSERQEAQNQTWNTVDVRSENLTFDDNFVVGFGSLTDETCIGAHEYYDTGFNWGLEDAAWYPMGKTYFIRAVVKYIDTGEVVEIAPVPSQDQNAYAAPETAPTGIYSSNVSTSLDDFQTFNIYKNDELIGETTGLYFEDQIMEAGEFTYHVSAVFDIGESEPSNSFDCQYNPNVPSTFSLLSPQDASTIQTNYVLLAWQRSDDEDPENTPHYDVWIDTLSDLSTATLIGDSLETTNMTTDSLADAHTYYWTVRATDTNSSGTWADETWSFTIPSFSSSPEVGTSIPKEFGIHKVYPNPFNSSTKLAIDLPVRSEVHIEVYNMLGQKKMILLHGIQNPGYLVVNFDASKMASGLYFIKTSIPNKMENIQKIVLIR